MQDMLSRSGRKPPQNFNRIHPELLVGEVWMGNMDFSTYKGSPWREVGARLGTTAYMPSGAVIPKLQPMFVRLEAVKKHAKGQKILNDLRRQGVIE